MEPLGGTIMANKNPQWEELGRTIRDIVDQAVSSQDYQKLNQTVRQTVSRAVNLGTETLRRASEKPQVIEQQDVSALYGPTGPVTAKGIGKIIGGAVLAAISAAMLILSLAMLLVTDSGLWAGLLTLAIFGGGIGLIGSGVGNLNLVSRFKIYKKTLGQKTFCSLEKLARASGRSVKSVRKEMDRLIATGLLPEGHLNNEKTMLITSHATYREFERSRLELEERKRREDALIARKKASAHTPQVREVLDTNKAERHLRGGIATKNKYQQVARDNNPLQKP